MWAWLLFGLGAYHGLNPAMGWLFAVALGLQEKTSRAVLNSLLPLGAGHLLSVGMVVGVAQMVQLTLPLHTVRTVAGMALIGFGLYRLTRRRHPRWVGMRVGPRDLTLVIPDGFGARGRTHAAALCGERTPPRDAKRPHARGRHGRVRWRHGRTMVGSR